MTEAYEMISTTELEGLRARLEKLEAVAEALREEILENHLMSRYQFFNIHQALAALDEKEPR